MEQQSPGMAIPEAAITNDNTGTLVATINADTSPVRIANEKVEGLAGLPPDLGTKVIALFRWAQEQGFTLPGLPF